MIPVIEDTIKCYFIYRINPKNTEHGEENPKQPVASGSPGPPPRPSGSREAGQGTGPLLAVLYIGGQRVLGGEEDRSPPGRRLAADTGSKVSRRYNLFINTIYLCRIFKPIYVQKLLRIVMIRRSMVVIGRLQ